MGTGLVYAALALMWALVLLPMWIRRHDEASEANSVDRFTTAMRILSRRGDTVDSREVLMPARPRSVQVSVQGRPITAKESIASRRRRTLGILAGLTLMTLGLGFIGLLSMLVAVVPVLLLVAFVVHLRTQAVRAAERERRRDASRRRAEIRARRDARPEPRREMVSQPVADTVVPRVETAVWDEPISVAGPDEVYDAVADHVWDPVPVPLPTYVTAPKAPRQVRVIDLTQPGAWTSGHLSDEAREELERVERERVEREQAAVADAREEIVDDSRVERRTDDERRRAVGD